MATTSSVRKAASLCVGALGALGLVLLWAVPFSVLAALADSLAVTGHSTLFTPELFGHLRSGTAPLCAAALILGAAGLALGARIDPFLSALAADLRRMLADGVISFRNRLLSGPDRWGIAAVILTALVLRLSVLGQPIRNDEAVSYVEIAARSLRTVLMDPWSKYHALNNILVFVSTRLLGDAEWAIRLPVFLAGMAVVVLTIWLGASRFSPRTGLVGGTLVGVAWPMVEYSANARGYMLGTAFMLACAQMLHYARERDNRAAWIGGALAAAVSIFSVPTMVVPLLGVALWLIGLTAIERKPSFGRLLRRAVPAAFIAAAATLILYFPYWVIEGPRSLFVTPSMLLPSPDATFFTAWSEMLGAFRLICDFALSTPVLAGACVLALIGIITAPEAAALFAGHLIAATAFLFLTHFGPIVARIYIPFFPFFALLAGRGVSRLERVSHRSTPVLALLVLMAAGAAGWNSLDLPERLQQDPIGAVRDARCRAAEILDRLEPGDGVVGTGLNAPLIYDLIREGRKRGRLMVHGTAPLPETQDYGMVQECPAATCAAQPRGYIFVTSNNSDTVPPLLAQLPIRLVLPFTHCAKGIVR